jgi:LEA14-like dessication related protein
MLGLWRTLNILPLLLILNLGGCASWFSDDSVDPAVHLVKVEVVRAKLLEQKFILHFRIDNPNDSDLTVRGME